MKYVVAIIQPYQLDKVREELEGEGINMITVTPVLGCGRQKGHTEVYRGMEEMGNLLKKVKIEIAVTEPDLQRTLDALTKGARTGNIGDGKVFIFEMEESIRIRTGETGSAAVW